MLGSDPDTALADVACLGGGPPGVALREPSAARLRQCMAWPQADMPGSDPDTSLDGTALMFVSERFHHLLDAEDALARTARPSRSGRSRRGRGAAPAQDRCQLL
jgi:hypothetical protein